MFTSLKTAITAMDSVKLIIYGVAGVILIMVLLIVIPNTSSIAEKLGVKTKATWMAEATLLKQQVKDLETSNQDLTKFINTQQKINELIASDVATLDYKLSSRDKRLVELQKLFADKVKLIKLDTTLTPVEKQDKIAEVAIQSLWDGYNQSKGVK